MLILLSTLLIHLWPGSPAFGRSANGGAPGKAERPATKSAPVRVVRLKEGGRPKLIRPTVPEMKRIVAGAHTIGEYLRYLGTGDMREVHRRFSPDVAVLNEIYAGGRLPTLKSATAEMIRLERDQSNDKWRPSAEGLPYAYDKKTGILTTRGIPGNDAGLAFWSGNLAERERSIAAGERITDARGIGTTDQFDHEVVGAGLLKDGSVVVHTKMIDPGLRVGIGDTIETVGTDVAPWEEWYHFVPEQGTFAGLYVAHDFRNVPQTMKAARRLEAAEVQRAVDYALAQAAAGVAQVRAAE